MKKIILVCSLLAFLNLLHGQDIHCKGFNKCTNEEVVFANSELKLSASEMDYYLKLHLPFGRPGYSINKDIIILVNKEFVIGYDTVINLPLWTAYLLTKDWANDDLSRCDCFRDDPRVFPKSNQETCDIYKDSGMNRGHLAPRDDFNRSLTAQLNTFTFTNIVPQYPEHNQTTWRWLEDYINNLAERLDSIFIITGIIFDYNIDRVPDERDTYPMISESRPLPVPSDFYKILLYKNLNGTFEALSLIVPHDQVRRKKYESLSYIDLYCRTSIDNIEKVSGFNFFHRIANEIEDVLEATTTIELW